MPLLRDAQRSRVLCGTLFLLFTLFTVGPNYLKSTELSVNNKKFLFLGKIFF